MDVEEVIKRIGISEEEFEKKVKEIREHFAGLISDETAVLLAAYNFGYVPASSIDELKEKRGIVTVEGVVEKAELKKLQNGEVMAVMTVRDDTGALRVVMWGEAAQLVRFGDIGKHDYVRLKGLIKIRDGLPELSVRNAEDVVVTKKGWQSLKGNVVAKVEKGDETLAAVANERGVRICVARGDRAALLAKLRKGDSVELLGYSMEDVFVVSSVLPAKTYCYSPTFTPIAKLRALQNTNVRGRVSGIGELRKVRDRLLAELYISDDSGRVRILLWDDNVTIYKQADVGDLIEVFNGFPKIGWDGEMEVHCGKSCIVSIEKLNTCFNN
ncbi:MAG TPA: hypothetical protein ENF96_01005 [Archaeoglobus veneficus]|nr:hypothetical protein [Archaeoglobus veneficus]